MVASFKEGEELTNWLILGRNGQLGLTLANNLKESNIEFFAVGRDECDVTDLPSLLGLVEEIHPGVIVNAAAWTAVDLAEDRVLEAFAANSDGARNAAIAARACQARLIHVSTDYVFAGDLDRPYEVDDVAIPKTVYGQSKLSGELAVTEEYYENSVIVRTAWLYSEYGSNFVKTVMRKALNHEAMKVVCDQFGQPTSAADLASHIVDLGVQHSCTGVLHGTNSGVSTWYDLAVSIYEMLDRDSTLVSSVSSDAFPTKAIRPRNSVLSHQRTASLGIPLMKDWRIALSEALPVIFDTYIKDKRDEL